MGRQSRRRRSELRRLRLLRPRPRSAGSTSPARSADAHARRSARAAGREAGTAAPGASDCRPSPPTQPYDRENDILLGPMLRNERRITIRSGELIVGLLARSTHGPETWSWALTGVERPDDADFVWRGEAETRTRRIQRDRIRVGALDLVGRSRSGRAAPARRADDARRPPASSSRACRRGQPACRPARSGSTRSSTTATG